MTNPITLDKLFNGGIAPSCMNIKVLDVLENKEVGTCKSQHEVSNLIWEKYNIKIYHTTIGMHLRNKIDAVCKGRFRFEYVDNEIVH